MKKINKAVLLFLLFTLVGGICFAAPKKKIDPLDEAIRETSDYLNTNLPKGSKIVILNIQSENNALSEYIIDELISNTINDKNFLIVDRQQLDAIRAEQNFQFSGEVDDKQALEIGKFFGASTIVSGAMGPYGKDYRFRVRALEVQTALVQGQFNKNITKSTAITTLLSTKSSTSTASASSNTKQTTPAATSTTNKTQTAQTKQTVQVPSQSTSTTKSQSNVIVVQGATLTEKLQWLEENVLRNTEYHFEIKANEKLIPQILSYSGKNNITIRLIGIEGTRLISHTGGTGPLFTIESGVTLILDNGITLQGRSGNNSGVISINSGGTLVMNTGSKITGNTNTVSSSFIGTGGVIVASNGTFKMNGGEISGNTTSSSGGGGVVVSKNAIFTMTGGEIFGNTAKFGDGGGVYIQHDGNFTMRGGEIYGNNARNGGGVFSWKVFTMIDGKISGNTARTDGGGIFTDTLIMSGGEISSNIAVRGGGVFARSTLTKEGGIIYGFTEGDNNSNRATGKNNSHAVGGNKIIRTSTAGVKVKLNSKASGAAGGWEN